MTKDGDLSYYFIPCLEKDEYTINAYNERLKEDLSFMDYFIPVFISAKSGLRFNKLMPAVINAYENSSKRISTSIVNELLQDAVRMTQPPSRNGRRLKFYYASQVSTNPPTFVFQTNDETMVHFSYQRYLENCIRRSVDFSGTPIKLIFRTRKQKDQSKKGAKGENSNFYNFDNIFIFLRKYLFCSYFI